MVPVITRAGAMASPGAPAMNTFPALIDPEVVGVGGLRISAAGRTDRRASCPTASTLASVGWEVGALPSARNGLPISVESVDPHV